MSDSATLRTLSPGACSDFLSMELVMLFNHVILSPLLLLPSVFPSIRVFSSESALCVTWPNIGASALASVFPVSIQG